MDGITFFMMVGTWIVFCSDAKRFHRPGCAYRKKVMNNKMTVTPEAL
jgi:hypothetical protein